MINTKTLFSNAVTILSGVDGIKAVYEATLEASKADFICTSKQYDKVVGDWYSKNFQPRLNKSTGRVRELLPNWPEYQRFADGESCRLVDLTGAGESDVIVTSDWTALVSFNADSPQAMVITDPELVKSMQTLFERLWEAVRE